MSIFGRARRRPAPAPASPEAPNPRSHVTTLPAAIPAPYRQGRTDGLVLPPTAGPARRLGGPAAWTDAAETPLPAPGRHADAPTFSPSAVATPPPTAYTGR